MKSETNYKPSPWELSVTELEEFIANYPRASACNRADVVMFEALLATRKQQQSTLTDTGDN